MNTRNRRTRRNGRPTTRPHDSARRRRDPRERMRRRRRAVAIAMALSLLLGVLVQVLSATGALAHAGVVSVTPANASVTRSAPERVTITFNEAVETDARRVQLLDAKGHSIPATFSANADSSTLTLTPRTSLGDGAYALRWSVVSADGHVVTGASTFAVGGPGRTGKAVTLAATAGGKTVRIKTTDGAGLKTIAVDAAGATTVELRHKTLGATLETTLVDGKATVLLPFTGRWIVTIVVRTSTFTQHRHTATLTVR